MDIDTALGIFDSWTLAPEPERERFRRYVIEMDLAPIEERHELWFRWLGFDAGWRSACEYFRGV